MDTQVIEFKVVCPEHGAMTAVVLQELPRPCRCPTCFRPLIDRKEVRRFRMEGAAAGAVGGEAFIG